MLRIANIGILSRKILLRSKTVLFYLLFKLYILFKIMALESKKEFEFPACWNDDIRMSALFAPFRSKSVNPTDWDSKMKFWSDVIENWSKCNKCPVIQISSLKNSFLRKNHAPACLEEVCQNLHSTGILVNKQIFMLSDENWKSWVVNVLVKNPLKWTFNTVKNTFVKTDEEVSYVHVTVVKFLSNEILKNVSPASQGKLVSFEDLMALGFPSAESLSVVLHWMQKQEIAAVSELNGATLVKLANNPSKPVKITEVDLTVYRLEEHQKVIEQSITKLYCERNAALEKTKQHLAAKMRDMAKMSLQRKKELEKLIEKRSITLENIQAIAHNIEQVKLDSEVMETYQKGISALKDIYKETGLNPQDVSSTMDELREVLNSRHDIDKALAQPIDSTLDEDLEEELNNILLNEAPDVPSDQLSAKSENVKKDKKNNKTEDITKQLEAMTI